MSGYYVYVHIINATNVMQKSTGYKGFKPTRKPSETTKMANENRIHIILDSSGRF